MRKLLLPGEGAAAKPWRCLHNVGAPIVGQIWVKAMQSVWAPVEARRGVHARRPLQCSRCSHFIGGAGLSVRKCEYLVDLARHFEDGRVHVKQWQVMEDEAIIEELVAIRGIGRWTAEMFLIFHLMRPDVLPLDDIGLIKGISVNYFSGEPVSRAEAREVGEAWTPSARWPRGTFMQPRPLPVDY
jgi:DNA-3-methyladenine glycosylase II